MTGAQTLFDGLLVLLLVILAWVLLASKDLFRAIVLFISFGLLLALAWLRLKAPDIALAEAIIGAGITGALLLVGLGRLGSAVRCRPLPVRTTPLQRLSAPLLVGLLLPSIAAVVLVELFTLPIVASGQIKLVAAHLEHAGVDHPVTAVLLNFRGYDTFLEMGVLLLAVLSIWSLDRARHPFARDQIPAALLTLQRLLLPLLILVAGYILQRGAQGPGGAFQAGALLAAGIILAALCGHRLPPGHQGLLLRLALSCGFTTFLLAAAVTLARSGVPLLYPEHLAGSLILLIEIAATFSIAFLLAAAMAGGHPVPEAKPTAIDERKSA